MTEATKLTNERQKEVIALADREIADSRKGIKRNLVRFGIAAAVSAGIFATLPFTTLPIIAGGIAGGVALIFGGNAASHYVNTREMDAVKREAGEEGFADKLKARADRAAKLSLRLNLTGLAGVSTFFLATCAMLAFPAAAPVLGAIKAVGSAAWLGGLVGRGALMDTARSTRSMEFTVNRWPIDDLIASIKPAIDGKPGITKAPAPAADFGRAANGNEPEVADDTPRKTPPALKM